MKIIGIFSQRHCQNGTKFLHDTLNTGKLQIYEVQSCSLTELMKRGTKRKKDLYLQDVNRSAYFSSCWQDNHSIHDSQ